MNAIRELVRILNPVTKSITGQGVNCSELKLCSSEEWLLFCNANGFECGIEGVYIPVTKRAYVNTGSRFLVPNVLHEYFGHGSLVENSSIGQGLLLSNDQAAYMFNGVHCISGVGRTNWENYEGFAMWLEEKLCYHVNEQRTFTEKLSVVHPKYLKLLHLMKDAEQRVGERGLIKIMGF